MPSEDLSPLGQTEFGAQWRIDRAIEHLTEAKAALAAGRPDPQGALDASAHAAAAASFLAVAREQRATDPGR